LFGSSLALAATLRHRTFVKTQLDLQILAQPDDTTCGPTCLQAVYSYFEDELPLEQVISEITRLEDGGTLAVLLACHALKRGYSATIYTYNLNVFDPTWFDGDEDECHRQLPARLQAQAEARGGKKRTIATEGYLQFLELGGKVRFQDLTPALIRKFLKRKVPILTGLSSTYLYHCARERDVGDNKSVYDDIAGFPMGHFVVLCGLDKRSRAVEVADPLHENPGYGGHRYTVTIDRLVGAIMLGVLTYDANMLVIEPGTSHRAKPARSKRQAAIKRKKRA
jgi:hypothetical protein